MTRETITVPSGSRVVVELVRGRKARTATATKTELRARGQVVPRRFPCRTAVYDLGTAYGYDLYTGDVRSKYTQSPLESSVAFNGFDRATVREVLLANLGETVVADSGRQIQRPYRFQVNEETAATGTVLKHYQLGATRRNPLSVEDETWARRVPAADRVDEINDRLTAISTTASERQALLTALAQARREVDEQWDAATRIRRGWEGTASAALTDGLWDVGLDSAVHYQPFELWDTAEFKVTTEPVFGATETGPIPVNVGPRQSSWTDLYVAPQLHQWTLQWQTIYVIGTIFFWAEVAIPQTGTFMERLPFFPYPYRMGGPQGGLFSNSYALSRIGERTRTYHAMLRADEAHQTFSPFFFIILVARIGGRVQLNYRNIPAGTLCAVLESRASAGGPLGGRRYVWRREQLTRNNSVFDFQPFQTSEVIGYDVLDVER